MLILLLLIGAMNITDAAFTVYWIENGLAEEANPLMAFVFSISGNEGFLATKVAVGTITLLIFWMNREHKMVRISACAVFAIYAAVIFYHLNYFFRYSC